MILVGLPVCGPPPECAPCVSRAPRLCSPTLSPAKSAVSPAKTRRSSKTWEKGVAQVKKKQYVKAAKTFMAVLRETLPLQV